MSNQTKTLAKRKKKDKSHVKYANPRMTRFVSELASGKGVVEAGLNAGYSEKYCKAGLYAMMKKSSSFRELVEKHAKHSVDLIRNLYKVNLLPRAFTIDERMLSEFEENPELAMRYPQTLTRVHKIAETFKDAPTLQFVNIQTLNALQITQESELEDIIEGEVVEHDDG